jgi:signal transduction histidine kinase
MTNQRHPVHLSIASSAEIEHTARRLRAMREEFLTTRSLPPHPPRPLILASWRRCLAMQVNPSLHYAPLAISHEVQLRHLREASQLLIRAARPVMSYLSDFLADSGYAIVLSDANGRLLEIIGDTRVRRRLERIDFVPGGDWSEAAAGTNAPGTALADGHVVQLLGAEHYCEGWQDLTCTAAPIRHPLSGEIMGVLDVTGNYRLIRPFLSSFIAATALQVQQRMCALLTSTRKGKRPGKAQPFPSNVPDAARVALNADPQWHSAGKYTAKKSNDARLLPYTQERRTHDAEFLAAAVSAISASLDIDVTLEKVAEQIAHLLRLASASVCLFGDNDEIVSLCTWAKQYRERMKSRSALEALLRHSALVSLVRERGEPIIIDDTLTSDILPTVLASDIRALLLLPLITARGVIGFILAPKSTSYHWLVDDVLPVLTLAAHAATSIENARHFTILQQHTRHLEVINTSEMEALREADRLKSNFVVAVSHDLKSPLTAIRTSVESLLDQGEIHSTYTHEHLLHNIAGQTNRLDRLVDQLLDLSRIEAGVLSLDRDWIELPSLLADTVAKFEELHGSDPVERDVQADIPLLYVDPDRIAQVVWNLLENAWKYASSCTLLKVEARNVGNEILIGIADRGPGIPAEEREKIFHHFYRIKRDQRTPTQGSGLGLAICQGIVQAHGGRIWVEDRPGGGSVFCCMLPLPATSYLELEGMDQTELFNSTTGRV